MPAAMIEMDTFGAASVVLAKYGLEDHAYTLNKVRNWPVRWPTNTHGR